jgi:AcrR family transcriptional regulator
VRASPRGATTKRRAETRARLLDAAFGVFADKGFGQATIEEVCAAAGFTRGAFYSNFGTLEELFYALYERNAELITNQVTEALAAPSRDLAEATARVVDALLLDRRWALVRGDFVLHAARHPDVAAEWQQRQDGLRTVLASRLAPAAARTNMPPALSSPSMLARATMIVYHGVMDAVLIDSDPVEGRRWLAGLLMAVLGPSRS